MKKLRVIHIFSGYGGGISSLIINLVENSSDKINHTLMAFSFKGGEAYIDRVTACGGKCIEMPRIRKDGFLKLCKFLNATFKKGNFDAVHCHIDGKIMPIFKYFADKHDVKTFVVHAHKTLYERKIDRSWIVHSFNRWCNWHFSTNYMTCSQWAAEYLYGQRFLIKRKAELIPNGINESLFNQPLSELEIEAFREEFGIRKEELIVCHVGRFNQQKNHQFIIGVAASLKEQNKRYKLILIGEGELRDGLQEKVKDLCLNQNIIFTGRRLDIAKLMQFSDLLILPSLWEGLPTVAVECQAAGTPMILADTITPQCDMGLGLLNFLPLQKERWVEAIVNFSTPSRNILDCISQVRSNGFTAKSAGAKYSQLMDQFIKTNS